MHNCSDQYVFKYYKYWIMYIYWRHLQWSVHQYPWSTLNQHPINASVDTWSIFHWHLGHRQSSKFYSIHMVFHIRVVSMECQSSTNQDIDWVPIKMSIKEYHWGYRSALNHKHLYDIIWSPVFNVHIFFFISLVLTLLYLTCLVKEDIGIYGNIIISKFRYKI